MCQGGSRCIKVTYFFLTVNCFFTSTKHGAQGAGGSLSILTTPVGKLMKYPCGVVFDARYFALYQNLLNPLTLFTIHYAPNFFTFNIIILDVFCENLAYIAPLLQILQPFSEEDPQMLWSEPCKMAKLVNVL